MSNPLITHNRYEPGLKCDLQEFLQARHENLLEMQRSIQNEVEVLEARLDDRDQKVPNSVRLPMRMMLLKLRGQLDSIETTVQALDMATRNTDRLAVYREVPTSSEQSEVDTYESLGAGCGNSSL